MGSGDLDTTALQVRLLGVPAAASIVRERIRAWLDGFGWPEDEADDVVLAVHEAVCNSIEHGYDGHPAGDVEVVGERSVDGDRQRVRIVVRDEGRWRRPRSPGYRGRGIVVMRGCMAGVDVRPGDTGTEVVLVSRPVPTVRARTLPPAVTTTEVRTRLT
ncbi:ATP-binding protein [Pseudonocardia abyssalis]|uniref:ATP-binding protein n=1 Tax=Pseudonocardia abyssalis TaxID=2792008 RepID=A0ABS6UTU4_9PSEU|nr:ATP-binding protein [Pseudonocardia abyssalis]MBW0118384.1 ATP-binding protein [Pseudonocardia abyssalis]MBW0135630.1 ATP-binding protein [Pseudonocardia abyssalis]